MLDEMKVEMQAALRIHEEKNNLSVETLPLDTSVIYVRCREHDSILSHAAYGPIAFSHYNQTSASSLIIIVAQYNTGAWLQLVYVC